MSAGLIIGLLALAALACVILWRVVDWQGIIADPSTLNPPAPPVRGDDGRYLPGSGALRERDGRGRFTGGNVSIP